MPTNEDEDIGDYIFQPGDRIQINPECSTKDLIKIRFKLFSFKEVMIVDHCYMSRNEDEEIDDDSEEMVYIKHNGISKGYPQYKFIKAVTIRNHLPKWIQDNTRR